MRQKVGLQTVIKYASSGKFNEHFFLRSKLLTPKNEEMKMGQSFYRKDGLDFLSFSYAEGF